MEVKKVRLVWEELGSREVKTEEYKLGDRRGRRTSRYLWELKKIEVR